MGLFQSKEEQEAEQAALRAEAEERKRLAAEKEFLASPLGQAHSSKQLGRRFLEVQIAVGSQRREAYFGSRDAEVEDRIDSSAGVIEEIEKIGWHLEHVNYVFQMTGQSSTARWLGSGEETSVSGATVGIYLFRSTDPVELAPPQAQ